MPSAECTSSSDESAPDVNPHTSLQKTGRLETELSCSLDKQSTHSSSGQSSSDSGSEDEMEVTQVLSHAERRRQKKEDAKPKLGEEGSMKGTHNKQPLDTPSTKLPKRQNSVWVGNLSFKTSVESLKKFFDGVGEITRVHMPTKVANSGPGDKSKVKENLGFAYVDFATPDAKVVAITLSENPLDGRRLLIKDGGDFSGRPSDTKLPVKEDGTGANQHAPGTTKTAQKILHSQKQPPGPTLFFGNLGFETTEATIREMLEHHHKAHNAEEGEKWIRKIRMGTFEDSGKCKGWAFVDFTSVEYSTVVLTNPRIHHLNGRKLVVEYASPEAVRRGGGGARADKDRPSAKQHSRVNEASTKRKSHPNEGEGDEVREGDITVMEKKRRTGREGHGDPQESRNKGFVVKHPGKRARTKPGAALAQAKRETAAIVPSQGQKIVF